MAIMGAIQYRKFDINKSFYFLLITIFVTIMTGELQAETCTSQEEAEGTCSMVPTYGDYCSVQNVTQCGADTADRVSPRPSTNPPPVNRRRVAPIPTRAINNRSATLPRPTRATRPTRPIANHRADRCQAPLKTFLPTWEDSLANNQNCTKHPNFWNCYLNGGETWANTSRRSNEWEWSGTNLAGTKKVGVTIRAKQSDVKLYLYTGKHYDEEMTVLNCKKGKTCRFRNIDMHRGLRAFNCQRENTASAALATVDIPMKEIMEGVSTGLDEKIKGKARRYYPMITSLTWVNAQKRCLHGTLGMGVNNKPGCKPQDNFEGKGYNGVDGQNKYRDEFLITKKIHFKPKDKYGFIDVPMFDISLYIWVQPVLKNTRFKLEFKDLHVGVGQRLTPLGIGANTFSDEQTIRNKIRDEFLSSFKELKEGTNITLAEDIAAQIESGIYAKAKSSVMEELNMSSSSAEVFTRNNVLGNKRRLQFTYFCDGAKETFAKDTLYETQDQVPNPACNLNPEDCKATITRNPPGFCNKFPDKCLIVTPPKIDPFLKVPNAKCSFKEGGKPVRYFLPRIILNFRRPF